MHIYDVVIIGAGVMGCAVARALSRYKIDVAVLEKAHDIGEGSSKANSGIIQAGFHARGGSLKGRSCVDGNALFPALVKELDVPYKNSGGLMVAFNDEGIEKLREKAARAVQSGAAPLPIISGDEARAREPRLSERVVAAMVAPTTGIISPFDLVYATAQNAEANGVEFFFNSEVERIEHSQSSKPYLLHLKDGSTIGVRCVANMAGENANTLDAQVKPADYVVKPRVGEFLVLDKQDPATAITHVIYQAEENDEGGALLAPTVEGNLVAGPTSRDVKNYHDTATTQAGLNHVWRVAQKIIPDLDKSTVITNFAGVRTNIVNVEKEKKDFVVRASAERFVSALGIKNPGMTSSPKLARLVVDLLVKEGLTLEPDPLFEPRRKAYVPFLKSKASRQKALVKSDESYGTIICRCEQITEGDIRAILRAPFAPTTMDGLKRRLRVGMGRCQGGFCLPRAVSVLAQEAKKPAAFIKKGEQGGFPVLGQSKARRSSYDV